MDKNQKSCIDFAIQAKPLELYVPEEQSGIRYHIWRLVTSGPFENFIMLLIVCNTIQQLHWQGRAAHFPANTIQLKLKLKCEHRSWHKTNIEQIML